MRRLLGAAVLSVAAMLCFRWDGVAPGLALAEAQPLARAAGRPAPEFVGIEKWLNSEPLTMQGLRGKVVLVDFWTFACSNCVHTLPSVVKWYETYQDRGLAVIGVHTPETPSEQITDSLLHAMERHHIRYPVAQDNQYLTWKAWDNHYWPALYLVDRSGRIAFSHFGEGESEAIERAIGELLAQPEPQTQAALRPARPARILAR
jgi:thiol-disulfide isomerase/thioredoxin